VREALGPRRIGPIGAATRAVGGLAAIAAPIALDGVTWWDLGAALLALPLTATLVGALVTAALRRRFAEDDAGLGEFEPWIRSLLVLAAVIAVGIGATFATPLDGATALWIFIGVSLLAGGARGDPGCEVVAIPNALAGRRDVTGCIIYSPIDALGGRRSPTGDGESSPERTPRFT
jgi:hypothetical protein